MDDRSLSPYLIPIVAIIGGFAVAIASILSRSKIRELEIRERIAMNREGADAAARGGPRHGFDRAFGVGTTAPAYPASSGRHRRAGIMLMGVGFGLMFLIGAAGGSTPSRGVGIGGFLVILGLAFFINSLFDSRQPGAPALPAPPAYPAPPACPASPPLRPIQPLVASSPPAPPAPPIARTSQPRPISGS